MASTWFDHIVSVQILDGCLRPVSRASGKPVETQFMAPARAVAARPVEVWLPAIGKTLPGSWIDDAPVTDKTTKKTSTKYLLLCGISGYC